MRAHFLFSTSLLWCSLYLRLGHFVLVSELLFPWTVCEIHVLHDRHHLLSLDFHRRADYGKFVLPLGLQLTSALPSLLISSGPLITGFLIILVALFLDVIAFTRVVKLLGCKRGTGTATIWSTVLFCTCSC